MVIFGPSDVARCMELGRDAAKRVTTKFTRPISLEFEKGREWHVCPPSHARQVYFPYILVAKKRYAGLFWTKPEKWDKMDIKGIESVRRDNCGLVRFMIDHTLRSVLMDRSVPAAIAMIKAKISELLQNKIDLSLLIITKQLRSNYKTPQPHAVLAEKMRKRDPATAPKSGDRVPYVVVVGEKKAKILDRVEHPLHVLEHGLAIDAQYYLENQLTKPLTRIFVALMPHPETLFRGDHTRVLVKPTPTSARAFCALSRPNRRASAARPRSTRASASCARPAVRMARP